ncbi:50S ribosomal protein L3 [archaeon]|nr:50S ribosomal protein L3 [archaeon]
MAKRHQPRSGSLQFWPRVRAKRIYSTIKNWFPNTEAKPLAFGGYKVGMTHIQTTKQGKKGVEIITKVPVTIIDCPPLKPLSIRFYKNTPYGSKAITQIFSKNLEKELARKISVPKNTKEEIPKNYDFMKLVVYTQPKLAKFGKKKPEIFEIPIGGDLEYAKSLLEKEINIDEVFKAGQFLDAHAITKGKGFTGPVKRFGISLKSHKSEKKRRAPGNLGAFTPRKTSWKVPQHGQHGYHKRTEYNKQVVLIDENPEKINQKGGFQSYGPIKNKYILIKGSIQGPAKRLIILTESIRGTKAKPIDEIKYISTESKQ